MNDKRAYYYPAIAYTFLLIAVWLLSWLSGMVEAFVGAKSGIESLVSAEGVRWAVRSSMKSLNEVPWGTIILVIIILGLLRGSGLKKALDGLHNPTKLTLNQKRALLFALLALLCSAAILFVSVMSPWNLLLGVTGRLSSSPFMHGWLLLFFFNTLFISMAYGFIYGNYRSGIDVLTSLTDTFAYSVPGLVALVPASGIIPCMEYTGVLAFFEMQSEEVAVFSDIVYAVPFLYIVLLHLIEKKEYK
jgi:p-aminobenzoyl-glutamate transporter AbgT